MENILWDFQRNFLMGFKFFFNHSNSPEKQELSTLPFLHHRQPFYYNQIQYTKSLLSHKAAHSLHNTKVTQ